MHAPAVITLHASISAHVHTLTQNRCGLTDSRSPLPEKSRVLNVDACRLHLQTGTSPASWRFSWLRSAPSQQFRTLEGAICLLGAGKNKARPKATAGIGQKSRRSQAPSGPYRHNRYAAHHSSLPRLPVQWESCQEPRSLLTVDTTIMMTVLEGGELFPPSHGLGSRA